MAGNRDFDFLKGIQLTLPNSDVIRRLSAMANIHSGWNKRLERLNEPFQAASKLLRSFDRSMAPFTATLRRLEEESEKCERLEAAGWLPHETMPFDELEDQTLAGDALDEIVDRHYRINWASAKASFLEFIESCALDEEAKATFREALLAHEAGLYRTTSRTLFPEIERLSRAEIHSGAMDKIASQPKLRIEAGNLTPGEMAVAGVHGLRLYYRLQDHLYAHLTSDEDRQKIVSSPIPNRHAAVHGYASYGTFKGSLNALIIAQFIFRTISALKNRREELGVAAA